MSLGGKKYDGGKPRMDLLPFELFSKMLENEIELTETQKAVAALVDWWNGGRQSKLIDALVEIATELGDDAQCDPYLPPKLAFAIAQVLGFGAHKYGDRNWEKGMKWSRLYAAALRHAFAYLDPDQSNADEETGYSHLAHFACCVTFLLTYQERNIGEDDRPNTATS